MLVCRPLSVGCSCADVPLDSYAFFDSPSRDYAAYDAAGRPARRTACYVEMVCGASCSAACFADLVFFGHVSKDAASADDVPPKKLCYGMSVLPHQCLVLMIVCPFMSSATVSIT